MLSYFCFNTDLRDFKVVLNFYRKKLDSLEVPSSVDVTSAVFPIRSTKRMRLKVGNSVMQYCTIEISRFCQAPMKKIKRCLNIKFGSCQSTRFRSDPLCIGINSIQSVLRVMTYPPSLALHRPDLSAETFQ